VVQKEKQSQIVEVLLLLQTSLFYMAHKLLVNGWLLCGQYTEYTVGRVNKRDGAAATVW
jgi:hypothetical protein